MDRLRSPISIVLLSLLAVVSCKTNVQNTQTFIVRVRNELKPSHHSDIKAWYKSTITSLNPSNSVTSEKIPNNVAQRQDNHGLLHVYNTAFHGFSASLSPQQAEELRSRPEILAVFPDRLLQVHTTRTSQFLGLTTDTSAPNGLLNDSDSGSNIIIGILDTGIWPERINFRDHDLGPIPSHWRGKCDGGEKFPKTLCNKKVIGARYFTKGYEAHYAEDDEIELLKSARDTNGHGTHTASTAAGRHVQHASFLGFAHGVATGVAPKARIAVYKVCGNRGCVVSDVLAGIDAAIEDNVDVLSASLGSAPMPYYLDTLAIGSFAAMEKGILFSASAGNSGPYATTVTNVAPWIITVGASTIDRKFPAELVLEDGRIITGTSLFRDQAPRSEEKYVALIYAGNAALKQGKYTGSVSAANCLPGSLDADLVRGKIVVCESAEGLSVGKAVVVKKAGGVGAVIANDPEYGEGLVTDAHFYPGLAITASARTTVLDYISSSNNPRANLRFRGTTRVGVRPAPLIAAFSSRGPNQISPHVLKPDLIAPGVDILAAWADGLPPTEESSDGRRTAFNIISGTSMSCPHVSGLAALLKAAHPDWSPMMIKSALMTTAYAFGHDGKPLLDETHYNVSNAFIMGAGHVHPERAHDPGLVYDTTVDDYVDFLCASDYDNGEIELITKKKVNCSETQKHNLWDLNYPAIVVFLDASVPSKSEVVVKREVTHVSNGQSTYTAKITNPKGAIVTVDEDEMLFSEKGQKQKYTVRIAAKKVGLPLDGKLSHFGRLTWTDGKHRVSSPIVVNWT